MASILWLPFVSTLDFRRELSEACRRARSANRQVMIMFPTQLNAMMIVVAAIANGQQKNTANINFASRSHKIYYAQKSTVLEPKPEERRETGKSSTDQVMIRT